MLSKKQRINASLISGCLVALVLSPAHSSEPSPPAFAILDQSCVVAQCEWDVVRLEASQQEIRLRHLADLYANGNASWQEWARAKADLARRSARAEAAAGLMKDLELLRTRVHETAVIDKPHDVNLIVLALQTAPVQTGVCVLELQQRDSALRSIELCTGLSDRSSDPVTPNVERWDSQTGIAAERVALLEHMPKPTSATKEGIQAALKLQILKSKSARQRSIEQLQRMESSCKQQHLDQMRQRAAVPYGIRLVLIGTERSVISPARLAAVQTTTRIEELRARAVTSLGAEGHASHFEARHAKARLPATQFQSELLKDILQRIDSPQIRQVATTLDPQDSLKEFLSKLPQSMMRNVFVVSALIRLRQGVWEAWTAGREAEAQGSSLRERELRLASMAGAAAVNEKWQASLERERAENEIHAAYESLGIWTEAQIRLANVLASDAADQIGSVQEFLRKADVLTRIRSTPRNSEVNKREMGFLRVLFNEIANDRDVSIRVEDE